jgi:predicted nuclease of predicted toxin-antitoxin system
VRWLADECVDASVVARLRRAGHDVLYMAEIAPAESDSAVIARAQQDKRLLLTEDKDFGELVIRRGYAVPGLVLLRIDTSMSAGKADRLDAAINRFGNDLFDRYMIVEEARFRSRPLRTSG